MLDFFAALGKNKIFLITILAWLVAQSIKVAFGVFREKRFDFKWFVGTGGMPSSHAASVTALATSVGLTFGFNSSLFAVTFIFAFIIMLDAQGVRRSSGRQAEALNRIMEDIYFKRGIKEERLKELIGHTPFEVLVGSFLGVVVALFCNL